MAVRAMIVALGLVAAATPLAAQSDEVLAPAPAGTPDTKYCMKVDPLTGSRIETTRCWTREKWASQGVDVDKEWAKEGVRVIG